MGFWRFPQQPCDLAPAPTGRTVQLSMSQDLAHLLEEAVSAAAAQLRSVSDATAAEKPSPDQWSRKEELGHLIDSATNNHVRFVRACLESGYRGPSYDGNGWVSVHAYREMSWPDLIDFWQRYNQFLAQLITRIPESALEATCVVGEHPPMKLREQIADYERHMQHHIEHILRNQS